MPGIPVLKPREVVAILAALDFAEVRQKGSHKQFRHADGRSMAAFHLKAGCWCRHMTKNGSI